MEVGAGAGAGAEAISCFTHSSQLAFKPIFSCAASAPPRIPLSHNVSITVKSSFMGHTLLWQLPERGSTRLKRGSRYATISAAIKRFKEKSLDDVIQSQKKLKLVTKLKHILLKQPDQKISLRMLAKYRKYLGLLGRRRVLPILRRYPALFQVYEEEAFSMYCRLTPQAHDLHLEELQIKSQIEDLLVRNLRKLLMMSATKRILLEKIGHIATDMGLPMDFRNTMCKRYPQFFRVVETDYGPALELTSWDPSLAVSAAEKNAEEQANNPDNDLIIDRPRKFNKINLPRGYSLSRKHRDHIFQFQEMPFISPYSDCNAIEPTSMEAEKHACALVHELLTLTVETKTVVDHLTLFRYDFKFSNKLRAMLLRHPEIFYVSLKGDRDSVFLREAYRGSELIEKGPLLLVQEKLHALMLTGSRQAAEVLQWEEDNADFQSDEGGHHKFDDSDNEWSAPQEQEDIRLAPKPEFSVETKLFEAPTEKDRVPRERW